MLAKLLLATSCKSLPDNFSKDALTKFFVLSNIRFVSGGSSENVEDLAMFSYHTFPIRRAPHARSEGALSPQFVHSIRKTF
ncbi:MAG: hypothetical protein DMG56_18395 [Acidobacteria bacterium]|nr:MAG: hypothetical protein DMG54_12160 [Acidobacteriota bacterium]PYU59418.1 MAG: hypothetical protein DMG56_18395 [Acidobacteriota bacterium]